MCIITYRSPTYASCLQSSSFAFYPDKNPTKLHNFYIMWTLVDFSLIFYWLCKVVSTNNAYTAVCVCGASGWEMSAWHCHITTTITMINDCSQQNVWSFSFLYSHPRRILSSRPQNLKISHQVVVEKLRRRSSCVFFASFLAVMFTEEINLGS